MADIVITATAVVNIDAPTDLKIAAAAITAGQALYLPTATTVGLADANDAAKLSVIGIALNGGATGQPIQYAKTGGTITFGGTGTAGADVFLSSDPGGICLLADVGAGETKVRIGYLTTTAIMMLDIKNYGVAL